MSFLTGGKSNSQHQPESTMGRENPRTQRDIGWVRLTIHIARSKRAAGRHDLMITILAFLSPKRSSAIETSLLKCSLRISWKKIPK